MKFEEGLSNLLFSPKLFTDYLSTYVVISDIPAMEAITNITCENNEDYTSFTLSFFFAENPYFTNTVLKKTYTVSPDLLDEKSPALTGHATSGQYEFETILFFSSLIVANFCCLSSSSFSK